MKKYILLALTLLSFNAHSEEIIYKCTSPKGEVNYVNITSMINKANGCVKTDLGLVDKPVAPTVKKNSNSTTSSNTDGMVVFNSEQKDRDNKRQIVLQKELEDEEQQLNKIVSSLKLLSESKTPDKKQIEEMTILKNQHSKNIDSLQKELGKKELPTSLPLSNIALKFENSGKNDNKIIVGK